MLNEVVVQGRFVREPELKMTTTGVPVISFSLACERSYKNSDGERETDFIDFVAWKSMAEFIARNFRKGDMILVAGMLQSRKFTAKDGKTRVVHEVSVSTANFCGSKPQDSTGDYLPRPRDIRQEDEDEDIPF